MNKKPLYIFLHPHRSAGVTIIDHIVKNSSPDEYFLIDEFMGKPNFKKKLKEEINNKNLKYILGHETFYQLKDLFKNREVKFFTMVRDPAEKIVSMYNIYLGFSENEKKVSFGKWYNTLKRNLQINFYYERLTINSDNSQKLKNSKMFFYNATKRFKKARHTILFNLRKLHNLLPHEKDQQKMFLEVKKLFDELFFIGFVEDSKNDLKRLFRLFGIPDIWENKNSSGGKDRRARPVLLTEGLRKRLYKENPYDVKLYNYSIDLMKKDLPKIK